MITDRTKAMLFPNLIGNCPDWDAIRAIADAHGLFLLEDSAHGTEMERDGVRAVVLSLDISIIADDLTAALLFLLAPDSGYVTGQVLPVNGGFRYGMPEER